jgi:hypothetical protein
MVFMLSLQVMKGDNKVVNLIDDWAVLKRFVGEDHGFYQRLGNDGAIEIRVQTGRIGFKKVFKRRDDSELLKILVFCQYRFIQISEQTRDEEFFK